MVFADSRSGSQSPYIISAGKEGYVLPQEDSLHSLM